MKKRLLVLGYIVFCTVGFAETGSLDFELKKLGEFYQVYITKEDRRGPEDEVKLQRARDGTYTAEISYWRSLASRDAGEEICAAYRWLLFGRGTYGKGAKAAFEKYPQLFQVNLRFYDVEFGKKVGRKKAEILPTQKIIPYLRVGVSRNSFLRKKINEISTKKALEKGAKCAQIGKEYLDLVWLDETYLRQSK